MRYVNLSSILAYTKITSSLAKKFPTYNSFIENKIMLEHEVSFGTYYCHDYITHITSSNGEGLLSVQEFNFYRLRE